MYNKEKGKLNISLRRSSEMRSFEKDYRYLLQNLIPHNRLPQELRRSIQLAMTHDHIPDLRRCSVLALERLERDSYFVRTDITYRNGNVIVTYVKKDGMLRLRLSIPRDEWMSLTGVEERPGPAPEPVRIEAAAPSEQALVRTTIDILPDVLSSLAISDRGDSIVERLNTLMGMMPEWLHFLEAEMLIVQDTPDGFMVVSEHIRSVSEERLLKTPIYARVHSTGRYALVGLSGARHEGLEIESERAESVAVVPVFVQEEFRGIMQILIEQPVSDTGVARRIDIACRIVEQVITINDQIEDITSVDTLTGIYNRHFYETQLPIEIERATRTSGKLSMLLLDIDDFKSINDTLGHKKGDEALSTVATLIKKNLRKIDLPFRYGGEEFVILLPGTAEIEAVHTAERLRSVINAYDGFEDNSGATRRLSVSVGVAVFPDCARTEDELFVKADAAMFRAKNRGKNRVELYRD